MIYCGIWVVARRDLRARLRGWGLWLAALSPVALVLLCGFFVSSFPAAEKSVAGELPIERTVVLIGAKKNSLPRHAELAFDAVQNHDHFVPELRLLAEPLGPFDADLSERSVEEFRLQVSMGKFAGMIIVEPGEMADGKTIFSVYGRAGSKELEAINNRLKHEIALSLSIRKGEGDSFRRRLTEADKMVTSPPLTRLSAPAVQPLRELKLIAVMIMAAIFSICVSIGMAPLFSSGHGLERSTRARLEIELSVLSKEEVVLGHMLAAILVSLLLILIYTSLFLVPLSFLQLLSVGTIVMFLLMSVAGLFVHAPCCFLIGLTGSAAEPSSPFQSLYAKVLGMSVPLTFYVSMSPSNIISKVLGYLPLTANTAGIARICLDSGIAWWELVLAFISVIAGAVFLMVVTMRVFTAMIIVSGDSKIGFRRLLQLVWNPNA